MWLNALLRVELRFGQGSSGSRVARRPASRRNQARLGAPITPARSPADTERCGGRVLRNSTTAAVRRAPFAGKQRNGPPPVEALGGLESGDYVWMTRRTPTSRAP